MKSQIINALEKLSLFSEDYELSFKVITNKMVAAQGFKYTYYLGYECPIAESHRQIFSPDDLDDVFERYITRGANFLILKESIKNYLEIKKLFSSLKVAR